MAMRNVLASGTVAVWLCLCASQIPWQSSPAAAATMDYLGTWNATATYAVGKVVKYKGAIFYSRTSTSSNPNRNREPTLSSQYWEQIGTVGNVLHSGLQAPSNAIGQAGDYYIDTANNRLFGPKNAVSGWPAGSISLIGPAGAAGQRGPAGPQGNSGPAGPQGPMGPAGSAGPQGPQGPMGPVGSAGPQGERGAQGDKGDTGDRGPPPVGSTLVDATGQLVGHVLGENGDQLVVVRDFGGTVAKFKMVWRYAAAVGPEGAYLGLLPEGNLEFQYEWLNCAGTAYLRADGIPKKVILENYGTDGSTWLSATAHYPTPPYSRRMIKSYKVGASCVNLDISLCCGRWVGEAGSTQLWFNQPINLK